MSKILIIGAYSAIAEATARLWASQGHRLYLVGHRPERLRDMAADLKIRGAESTDWAELDANDFARHAEVLSKAISALQGLDLVLIAHGTLGDQSACERDASLMLREMNTNALSVMSLVTHLSPHFESQGSGTIAVITSVAGDRGRASNYVYGSAKGAVSLFLQGLRQRLHPAGVHVLTIKPGFVDTPMTAAFPKGPLWATPERVARGILKAIRRRHSVAYIPCFWRGIMAVIRAIPECMFKRIKL